MFGYFSLASRLKRQMDSVRKSIADIIAEESRYKANPLPLEEAHELKLATYKKTYNELHIVYEALMDNLLAQGPIDNIEFIYDRWAEPRAIEITPKATKDEQFVIDVESSRLSFIGTLNSTTSHYAPHIRKPLKLSLERKLKHSTSLKTIEDLDTYLALLLEKADRSDEPIVLRTGDAELDKQILDKAAKLLGRHIFITPYSKTDTLGVNYDKIFRSSDYSYTGRIRLELLGKGATKVHS